jgi:hypothetical protein
MKEKIDYIWKFQLALDLSNTPCKVLAFTTKTGILTGEATTYSIYKYALISTNWKDSKTIKYMKHGEVIGSLDIQVYRP